MKNKENPVKKKGSFKVKNARKTKNVDGSIVNNFDNEIIGNEELNVDVSDNVNLIDENKVNSKKNNKVLIILLSVLLVILIFISVFLCIKLLNDEKNNSNKVDNKTEVKDENNKTDVKDENNKTDAKDENSNNDNKGPFDFDLNDKGVEVPITDSEVVNLYNIVSAEKNEYDVYSKDEFLVKDMSAYTRGMIAKNVYLDKIVSLGYGDLAIDEVFVQNAYNYIFGEGYYSNTNDAYCGFLCCTLKYDSTSKRYVGQQLGCGPDVGEGVYVHEFEELVKAVKYSDRLEIEASVMYVYQAAYENGFIFYYKDYGKNVKLPIDNISFDEARTYQKQNPNSLDKITYVFKLNNGQYNYYGVYRKNK